MHPAKGSYLSASIRPTKLGLLLGLRGWGGSHGRGSRLPPHPRPEPPDPMLAPSEGAGTRGQAPRGREEAAAVGRGGAGRGRLPGPARRGLGSDYLEEQRQPGKARSPPGLALNLNLYLTLRPEGGEGTHLS